MLGPDEHFTVLSHSGSVPKKPHQSKSLALLLGPDFVEDELVVETSDHARLALKLSYNWYFEILPNETSKIFAVPDPTGDLCKSVASYVRGSIASISFEEFHKNSTHLIKNAISCPRKFYANNLVLTNIDVQSVEPLDQRTKDALQKSVQLAIEIAIKEHELAARLAADRNYQ